MRRRRDSRRDIVESVVLSRELSMVREDIARYVACLSEFRLDRGDGFHCTASVPSRVGQDGDCR